MKLTSTAETFNLGDTSFRRKTLIDDYKTLLPFLHQTNLEFPEWNNEAQAEFYEKILNETDLFSRNDKEDFAKRGRTLTNSLVKIGLTNEKRKLSKIALDWLADNTLVADDVEKSLGIDPTNLLFTRQLLKLRIYDSNGMNYFYPFRVALEMVKRYQNIPQQEFLTLVHLIQPTFSNKTILAIVEEYGKVVSQQETFSEFLDKAFPDSKPEITVNELFEQNTIDRGKFNTLFVNRKSSTVQDIYFEFVKSLLSFKAEKTQDNLNVLMEISSDDKIKKAFGFGKNVFVKANNVREFLEQNSDNKLLQNDNSQIYNQFVLSKKDDIVREYRDMTKRTFNLSGIFDFSNGLVNASNLDVFSIVFSNMIFSGEEQYSLYEQNPSLPFYCELSVSDILALDKEQVLSSIKEVLGVTDSAKIEGAVAERKEDKFRKFVLSVFPREKIIELLPLFSTRNDNEIKAQVSEAATVPTIYEYIVAIAWFYISSEKFFITKSMNLTLDGNMLPLSHAAGGAGDIVIDYENLTLMLEVTLMNKQAQKRGEWEPVLRHATNLTVDKYPKDVITIFVADDLDENTVNIWRAVASVPLRSSNKDESAELVKIFPLENRELLDMLRDNSNEQGLLKAIDESYGELAGDFNLDWRGEILQSAKLTLDD